MPVTTDIVESWRRPRVVMRRLLARGPSEPFALSFLLAFLALALASLSPGLARQSWLEGGTPVMPRLFASALGLLATIPLWYLVAALGHLVARALGGKGSFCGARLALFWSLLVTAPAMLVQGLVQGLAGAGQAVTLLGVAVGAGFLVLWVLTLREAES
jgi:hypothetical protein